MRFHPSPTEVFLSNGNIAAGWTPKLSLPPTVIALTGEGPDRYNSSFAVPIPFPAEGQQEEATCTR